MTHRRQRENQRPRTKHLNKKGEPLFTNQLFFESSPYLLQHAHNPVNWSPWKPKAFNEAKELNRPILLSIGYSTCHWCHVMEEESFENLKVAAYINEHYIPIKVDREERPDIDAIYMNAVQLIAGHGGWPMTLWLTHEKKPFFAGTYFPPEDGERGVHTGFITLLTQLKKAFDEDHEKILLSSESITKNIQRFHSSPPPYQCKENGLKEKESKDKENQSLNLNTFSQTIQKTIQNVFQKTIEICKENFDSYSGGLKETPKFPSRFPLQFLLKQYKRTKDETLLDMINLTLEKMAQGGIYDQIGGGFHRYSTDSFWMIPHFEKMLYDNALLSLVYTEAYQCTQNTFYKKISKEILDYALREMSSNEGGFYSATDADSLSPSGDMEEGHFFTWLPKELESFLTKEELQLVKAYYNIQEKGTHLGRNALRISTSLHRIAQDLNIKPIKAKKLLSSSRKKMNQARLKRPKPLRDEKVLLSWNALMMSALATSGFVYNEKRYLNKAEDVGNFILKHLQKKNRLYHVRSQGRTQFMAYLDDYAFFIAALLSLYEYTGKEKWLKEAIKWDKVLETHFEDKLEGGFFMTSDEHEKLFIREKPRFDEAEPSGNSVSAMNLLRLAFLTKHTRHLEKQKNVSYLKRAEKLFEAFSKDLTTSPLSFSEMLLALDFYLNQHHQNNQSHQHKKNLL